MKLKSIERNHIFFRNPNTVVVSMRKFLFLNSTASDYELKNRTRAYNSLQTSCAPFSPKKISNGDNVYDIFTRQHKN